MRRNYHAGHKRKASAILRSIESERGPTPSSVLKACDTYAAEVLGWVGFAPWLYVYSAIRGGFHEGWIPDNYFGEVVVPVVKGAYGHVSNLKSMTHYILGHEHFPDIAIGVNGMCLTPAGDVISKADLPHVLFVDGDRVVFKSDGSTQGRGVQILYADAFDAAMVPQLGNGVFQAYVMQHEALARIHHTSVATLRLTTITTAPGQVSVRAAYLRVGTGNDTHVQSASHLRVPVDVKTGKAGHPAYAANWRRMAHHAGYPFGIDGFIVPSYDACVAVVKGLHRKIPFVRCIGWDVTVDTQGRAVVLEWNGAHNDIKFSEAVSGPCFADLGWENLWRTTSTSAKPA